jgi:hypothetical protein
MNLINMVSYAEKAKRAFYMRRLFYKKKVYPFTSQIIFRK